MEETQIDEQVYIDGFNRGYWLYNYEPEVAQSLVKANIEKRDDFSVGFAEGLNQAKQEKTLSEFEHLRNNIHKDLEIDR